ncbi:MAG TPA: hypothetical protein VHY31_27795 [Streptosporangiaceae bacterium]|nr:hypothetical protein [Streptosporangiaceae bacterium]
MELTIPVAGGEVWAQDSGTDGPAAGPAAPGLGGRHDLGPDERITGRIPGCDLIVVPGADHLLPLRTPGALADIIDARAADLR